jgi:formate dehydrogenase subunit beta
MAKKGDMLYAWTNDAEIKKKAELGGAVTSLWKYALESKMVDAVLAVTKGVDIYDAKPVIITDPAKLKDTAGSLHCGTVLMPKLIKKYLGGVSHKKIGVTVKGCDAVLTGTGLLELRHMRRKPGGGVAAADTRESPPGAGRSLAGPHP